MIELKNEMMTQTLAEIIGEVAEPGDNLILTGDLGAGKTTLTKGIALGLDIKQMIKSPTYTIIREYPNGRLPLYHMDVYRIEGDADELGLEEYFEGEGLSVIEWGNLLEDVKPAEYLELVLEKDPENNEKRYARLQAFGNSGEQFKKRILESWAEDDRS